VIVLKTPREIEALRAAGRIARLALDAAVAAARPGAATADIDAEVERVIRSNGATPEFKGYHGFPASSCISVNHEVVHGIPGPRRLKEGDIVGIDVGARFRGFVGDNAATVCVGRVSAEALRLVETTRECLDRAVAACVPGARLSDVGRAVQSLAESRGYSVVRDYAGHGIGARMHEDPQVPNYVDEATLKRDIVLKEGLCLALEPMLNAGGPEVRVLEDDWTVVTKDGSLSAHWEDAVAVTKDGPLILTRA
jgi:methionyl aminopeptidase